jgi:4'-phosphopantetheinyl transferase
MAGQSASLPPTHAASIGVAQCHLADDRDMSLVKAWGLLSADETARAGRFHFDRDRDRYVRGRGFLRSLLGQVCGLDPAGLIFGTGAQGKPFLQGSTLAFNLSHSRDLAVLALSQAGPLGIDIEFIDRKADIMGLMQSCMTDVECAVLMALPEAARNARFFAFWTAKEARMKLTGEGMSLSPRHIALHLQEGLPIGYLAPKTPLVQAIFLDLGHSSVHCCLALAQGAKPIIKPLILTSPVLSSSLL